MWTRIGLVILTSLVVGRDVWAQPETAQVQTQRLAVAALVKRLTSTELDWKERVRVQKELMKLPPLPVLVSLLPEMAKGMPSMAIWNGSGSAEMDAKMGMPAVWQVSYRVHELWDEQDRRLSLQKGDRAALGRELAAYLQKVGPKGYLLLKLAGEVESNWVPEAEAPVAALFLNDATEAGVRLEALRCLLQNTGTKYLPDAKKVASAWPETPWQQLLVKEDFIKTLIVADSRNRNVPAKSEPDTEILRLGFGLLPTLEKEKAGTGYFLAGSLGTYVGQKFSPDQNAPEYQGEHGLADAFFSDTSKKALAWWENHRL